MFGIWLAGLTPEFAIFALEPLARRWSVGEIVPCRIVRIMDAAIGGLNACLGFVHSPANRTDNRSVFLVGLLVEALLLPKTALRKRFNGAVAVVVFILGQAAVCWTKLVGCVYVSASGSAYVQGAEKHQSKQLQKQCRRLSSHFQKIVDDGWRRYLRFV